MCDAHVRVLHGYVRKLIIPKCFACGQMVLLSAERENEGMHGVTW